ncbi:S-adenosyl-L-methionine-dependent methyltransferase [Neurospora tetraspora]|uniref:S-adenosyl-L-methionine-dependent methyltransferase n=1 Tax=Neurospora tetraspora TaxID=94610 RepID=A0AAE0JAC3_9PEZI|nr:S-adenosyl-L-methionine-dependent methyltransferase [Neurospora tetraspora]
MVATSDIPADTSASLLTTLVDEISSSATLLSSHLESRRLPWPSFSADGPPQPFPEDNEEVSRARVALIEATRSLHALAVGPVETTKHFCFNEIYLLGAMQVLCHFEIPQNVPLQGTISFHDLASKTGLSEALLPRFLRMAIANFYFAEPEPGLVAHSAWSKPLATDEKMRACVWFRHAEMLPAVSKLVDMVKRYPDSPEPQDTAFSLAFGDTFFGYKERHPENMVKFGQFVGAFSGGSSADSAENIARAYPWETLPNGALVVDVGGGIGHISASIAQAHPHLRFQVQDFEDLKGATEELMEGKGVKDRVEFVPHNFFDPQPEPARGAAVYFMRNILHNWSDLYCRRILKPIAEAMGKESRIVNCDIILPEPNSVPKTQDAMTRALDLTMLSLFNAKEKSIDEWKELFASADGRLAITDVVGKPRMRMDSLVEVRLSH